ncbi:type II secretion system F family protein [Methylotenera sp. 1P/1]|uniref:type II secretion system F family protein n=1 Tax=Methylotenera sp. 1P/1 TaxID=1131551 RepID=UPI000378715E|nr:type II secretion system F family protein [Methylotenera sp. 1P/1]
MKFELKVMQGSQVSALALEAPNVSAAKQLAESQGLQILSIQRAGFKLADITAFRFEKHTFNVMLFSQELLALLESGMSLMEAIEALSEKEQQVQSVAVFKQMKVALYEGLPLSQALERLPETFTALYVALIRASERTGDMPQALRRHVAYQTQVDAVRKKIIAASIYPSLLMVVGGLVVLFLLGYVIPRFSGIYENTGQNLPWASQMLLKWGQLLQTHGSEVLMVTLASSAGLMFLLSRSAVRAWIAKKIWQIPTMGEAIRIYQLARFYRTLGMLLQGGIPLTTAMQMVQSLLLANLQIALKKAIHDVKDGKPLSMAMEQHGMTTSISNRMLRVGERTGRMDEMLERIGAFYDEETARKVEWLSKLLEPALMVVIGLIVGLVVVLMYMPIFELAGGIE